VKPTANVHIGKADKGRKSRRAPAGNQDRRFYRLVKQPLQKQQNRAILIQKPISTAIPRKQLKGKVPERKGVPGNTVEKGSGDKRNREMRTSSNRDYLCGPENRGAKKKKPKASRKPRKHETTEDLAVLEGGEIVQKKRFLQTISENGR